MLDIVKIGDEVLREKCTPVTEFDDALHILLEAMYETLEAADGVGLAAPQVGVDKRFFIVSLPDGTKREFINPEITGFSVETNPYANTTGTGLGVAFLFTNDIDKLEINIPLAFTQGQVERRGLEVVIPCESRVAGVIVYYPMSALVAIGV